MGCDKASGRSSGRNVPTVSTQVRAELREKCALQLRGRVQVSEPPNLTLITHAGCGGSRL